MKTSETGIDLIKHYEGLQLNLYLCPAGKPTIGYGHTGPDVVFGITITEADADKLLREDLHFSEKGVQTYTHVPLTQGQFDALVSFTYNLGVGALRDSTLFRRSTPVTLRALQRSLTSGSTAAGACCRG